MKEPLAGATRSLGPIRAKTLPDDVYDVLVDMLTWGTLEPGAPLSIDGLAHSLGISPTPVREALARLEHTGLLHRTVHRGYRVAPPMSTAQMSELADARLVLEAGAMERAMREATELLPDLERALARQERSTRHLLESGAPYPHEALRRYFEDDWSFHEAILKHCRNRYIAQAVDSLSFRVHRMRQTVGTGSTDAATAVAEHRAILAAVRNSDAAQAVEQIRVHLINVAARVSS